MKKTLQNTLKVGAVIALMLSAGAVSAQTITGDIAKAENANAGKVDGAVRVIDNKGTIKYLQSSNGITTLTNTTNNVTTTTWQLGGTLASDTEINAATKDFKITLEAGATTADKAGRFILNGIKAKSGVAATEIKTDGTAGTGYTLLVRDEETGAVKKMLATDLIISGQTYFTATDGQEKFLVTTANGDATNGLGSEAMVGSQIPLPNFDKVWVYRNGAKLIAGLDYKIDAINTSQINLITVDAGPTITNEWKVYAGDIIEVQYYK
jgi:hypothetical protein